MKLTHFLKTLLLTIALNPAAHALDLVEALTLAQQNDAAIDAAYANYLAAIEQQDQSTAALYPQISADIFANNTTTEVKDSASPILNNGKNDFDSVGYTLQLNQTLYNQEQFDLVAQADALALQSLAVYESEKQDLITRTATAYFQVLGAIDNLTFATAEKKANAKRLEQNQERFNVGLIAITDVIDAQATYDTSVAQEIVAINTLSTSREALWVIINAPAENLNPLQETIPLLPPEPDDIKLWQDKATSNNMELRSAKYAVEAARSKYDSSHAGHYPTLSFNASHGFTDADGNRSGFGDGQETEDTIFGVNLNVPIYTGGFTSSKTRQSMSELDQAKALHEQQRRLTVQDARITYLSIKASVSQVKALKQALESTQSALDATQAGYEVGTRTIVDVLITQGNLYRSERDYAKSRYEYILNLLEIKRAVGSLSAADIQQINQWLVH
jgi:outer membrane protein